jgi:hypothetical protein
MQVRPNLGEGLASYIQRLARANHLPPRELTSILFPEGNSAADLDRLARLTNRTVTDLQRALPDAPGRTGPEQGKDSLFPPAVDRKLTAPNDRIDLVLLIFDALYEGLSRHVLHHRYRLPRRLVRLALQHQSPRQFKRRGPSATALFKTINQLPIDDTLGRHT